LGTGGGRLSERSLRREGTFNLAPIGNAAGLKEGNRGISVGKNGGAKKQRRSRTKKKKP